MIPRVKDYIKRERDWRRRLYEFICLTSTDIALEPILFSCWKMMIIDKPKPLYTLNFYNAEPKPAFIFILTLLFVGIVDG